MTRFLLDCHFLLKPELEALVVDESDTAIALTGVKQWIGACLLSTPTDFALNITAFTRFDDATVNLNGFFRIEIIVAVLVVCVTGSGLLFISLLYGRGASIDNAFSFEIAISWLRICPEVLYTELQTA